LLDCRGAIVQSFALGAASLVATCLLILAFGRSGSLKGRIPSVLDGIVRATWESLGDFGPSITQLLVRSNQCLVFFVCPLTLLDGWVEVIVPPLPTLFAEPAVELTSNVTPFLGTVMLDKVGDNGVFFSGPWSFHESRAKNFLPTVKTLHVSPSFESAGNLFPILSTKLVDRASEELVFSFGPLTHGSTAI